MKTPLFWLPKNTPYNNTLRKDGASNDGEEREVGLKKDQSSPPASPVVNLPRQTLNEGS